MTTVASPVAVEDPSAGPSPRRARGARILREVLLSAGAIAGVICLLAAVGALAFDLRPLVFRSGSMSPQITTGALAIARSVPATDLEVGDVVSVVNTAGIRVTHRVQSLSRTGPAATLVLKGDVNSVPDAESYLVTRAELVILHVNGLGYPVAWLSGRGGVFLGGLLAGSLLMYAFGSTDSRHRLSARRARNVSALGLIVVMCVAAGAVPAGKAGHGLDTQATWTEPASVKGSNLSTLVVPVPTLTCAVLGLGSLRLTWTGTSPYPHRITVGTKPIQETPVGTSSADVTTPPLSTGPVRIQAFSPYPGVDWVSATGNGFTYTNAALASICIPA